MTILVTGASGLIGSHLCETLVEGHYDIIAVARSTNPLLESVKRKHPKRIKVIPCDIQDRYEVTALIDLLRPETVFHLAACCLPHHTDTDFIDTNIGGTVNLVSALQRNKTNEFIYASSMSVYSTPPDYLSVDEHHPTQPDGVYGKSKLTGEYLCDYLSKTTHVAVLRFASVFGVGDTSRVAGLFAEAALSDKPLRIQGDGTQSSDFIYVDDAVQGIMLAWKGKATGVYNIGSGQLTTIKVLARAVIQATGSKSKIELSGSTHRPFRFVSDVAKARDELHFAPGSLQDGLNKYMGMLRD